MPSTRVIEDFYQTGIGLVARSNDGRAYLYKGGPEPGIAWHELPALPQEGYVDPMPTMFDQLGSGFQGLHQMMEQLHGGGAPRARVGATETCPVDNCGFTGSVADVTTHMEKDHG